jgi:hypothetical protein
VPGATVRGVSSASHIRPPSTGPRQGEPGEEGLAELPSLASWEESASPAPPGEVPLPVQLLVQQAQAARGAERGALAARINHQLEALASGGGSREVADLLHQLLEGGQLTGLEEPEGRTCRAVAVEALLALGFPYALEVRPEDLEHLRRRARVPSDLPWLPAAAAGSLGAGLLGQWLALPRGFLSFGDEGALLLLFQALSVMGLVAALWSPERSAREQAGVGLVLAMALAQLFLGLFGGSHGAVSGVGGLLACLLLMLPRR